MSNLQLLANEQIIETFDVTYLKNNIHIKFILTLTNLRLFT
jgi:hypothetical protein